MRVTVGMLGAISALFVGVFAISESAQQTQPQLSTQAQNESFDVATNVFGGVATAGDAVVWGGIGAVVLVALGVLVTAGGGR